MEKRTVDLSLLDDVLAEYASVKGSLITILQHTQDIYGYLPYEVQKMISDGTGIPIEKVYGVASFYAQFTMSPKGENEVSVCLGTACYVKGAADVLDALEKELGIEDGQCTSDGKFSLDTCRCVGACGLAPVFIVNGDVYGKATPDKVHDIIEKYK